MTAPCEGDVAPVTLSRPGPVRARMTMISPVEAPAPVSRFASPATRRLLMRYIARRVPACDVDDVVQATLLDALASGRAPSGAEDFQRWLLSIARFKVIDTHRAAARATPGLDEALPAAPSPVEALHLMRWVEHQIARDQDHQITLRWMAREAEGDKLESIAADESVPAPRVRQRVSRLRRWMRERGIEPPELSCLPLRPAASEAIGGFVPVQLTQSTHAPIRMELRKGAATVTVEWPASSAAACGVWLREWLG